MKNFAISLGILLGIVSQNSLALTSSAEEFHASRALACVLAEQSLGYLTEQQYGERTHDVLDGFDDAERDQILAKALGYYDGLMFSIEEDAEQVQQRLRSFTGSTACQGGFRSVTLSL